MRDGWDGKRRAGFMSTEITHYCQKCLAANPLGQDFCSRCGTRLMIVVEPASMRYEITESGATGDEHLLERISVLENRLGRLADRLERTLDLLLRQAQNSYFDRALLKTLISLLNEDGIVETAKLERLWQKHCEQDAAAQEQSIRREEVRAKILGSYHGTDRASFEQLINDGFMLIEDGENDRGIRTLERAAEMQPVNSLLLSFLGEHFFRSARTKLARTYLTKAFEVAPEDNHVLLLLGLVCGDEGETERARELLNTATRRGGPSFAAYYGLGRLFVAEQNWDKALREFKRALAAKPSPEAHYALACLYYEIKRDEQALSHLLKALELDEGYAEASYLLGLVYKRSGYEQLAQGAFEDAHANAERSLSSGRKNRFPEDDGAAATVFKTWIGRYKRLVTGGDLRLAKALREDALKAFTSAKAESR
jgi:tetratricopeptide (TPR) repeat protein